MLFFLTLFPYNNSRKGKRMIIEKTVKVKDLPPALQIGNDPNGFVRVSVQTLTENGFTAEFEREMLEAEKEAELSLPMSVEDFLKELKSFMSE
jgi:hypothetical protein